LEWVKRLKQKSEQKWIKIQARKLANSNFTITGDKDDLIGDVG
jgi:hypothetical protein